MTLSSPKMTLQLSTSVDPNVVLPPEIFRDIFSRVVSSDVPITKSYHFPVPNPRSAPMVLTFVCKRWRDIAFSIPRLWSAYTLHFTSRNIGRFNTVSENSYEELYKLWNKRSANTPLTVHLIIDSPSIQYEDVKDLAFRYASSTRSASRSFESMGSLSLHWRFHLQRLRDTPKSAPYCWSESCRLYSL